MDGAIKHLLGVFGSWSNTEGNSGCKRKQQVRRVEKKVNHENTQRSD